MTHIESRPSKHLKMQRAFEFFVDFKGNLEEKNTQNAIAELRKVAANVTLSGTPEVPWFPTNIVDMDQIGKRILSEGDGIQEADHPGFRDPEYKARRDYISKVALDYSVTDLRIPMVEYNEQELWVWSHVYPKLKKYYEQGACT